MDLVIAAAARALAAGDPLAALNRVALRDDPLALALRGTAMAQLGDLERARLLLRRAKRSFGPHEVLARARCAVAEAEIALAMRNLTWPARALDTAHRALEARGDRINAAHARLLAVRRLVLMGRLLDAERNLAELEPAGLPPALQATHALALAWIAIRRVNVAAAQMALATAERTAHEAGIAGLSAEVEAARDVLERPAALLVSRGSERLLRLAEVETLLACGTLVVDACRHAVRAGDRTVLLARRPVLFALVRVLAEAWPGDAARDVLLARAFGARYADESHRVRLRVETGRLRVALRGLAAVTATRRGFVLAPNQAHAVVVLAPPAATPHGSLIALLADGEAWSSSSLAIALTTSQRQVQRALEELAAHGAVQPVGRGRARRWMTPLAPEFATALLLPAPLPDA